MRNREIKNAAASVRERLYQAAVRRGEDFGLILTRYALERLLYRLSLSPHRERLILKGAMLFLVWADTPHRPTRDLDLLGFGDPSMDRCREMIGEICAIEDAMDGLLFDVRGITAEAIKEDDIYHGVRVRVTSRLAQARISMQIDIGFGDLVSPAPLEVDYPTLLEMPAPRIRSYSMESVIAEKIEAMVSLGMLNSRMKDFYDVWFLARTFRFESSMLGPAIEGTFARRTTVWSREFLEELLTSLSHDEHKQVQWRAFVQRSRLSAPQQFSEVIEQIRLFAMIPTVSATWLPGGPWRAA